jgi:phage tail sheath protein FI
VITYSTPGVYYERADTSPPRIPALRTDIAGFVGIALKGPPDLPVRLQSWRQFQANFGDVTGVGFLAYAVRAFFANGGQKCWVVRVASPEAAAASTVLNAAADPVWNLAASSPGVWGNDLELAVRLTHLAQTVSDGNARGPSDFTAVTSISGFRRGTLVRITQGTSPPAYKVVSGVDAANSLLLWVAASADDRLPYDAPLTGFSGNLPLLIESIEYTLLVWQLGQLLRIYEGLSLVPEHPRYGPIVLPPASYDFTPSAGRTQPLAPKPIVLHELRDPDLLPVQGFAPLDVSGTWPVALAGGADALSLLSVEDFVGEDVDPLDDDAVRARKQRGLRALDAVDEVSMLAVPDIQIRPIELPRRSPLPPCVPDPCLPAPPPVAIPRPQASIPDLPPVFSDDQIYRVQATMIARCEDLRDRVALLDPPYSAARDDAAGVGAIRAWRDRFDSKYAVLYYPWIRVVDPLALAAGTGAGLTRDIPPCGHVAGQYAATDLNVGVFKAPANTALTWAQDLTVAVNDTLHGVLNSVGVNAIRALGGRGIRLMGARTLSGDTDWRFVNVVRLLAMIKKAIYVSTQWAVFEPNDGATRTKLRLSLNAFLISLWQQGALMGDTPDAAFYVTCDATNNAQTDVDNGQLLAEVGVAPSQPFEFVVLRVGRTDNEFQITDVSQT